MSASTPTQPSGPPVPPVKPILSSPGAYMANFQSPGSGGPGSVVGAAAAPGSTGASPVAPITAGIHSSNKTHEKPTIAARPIPPPTLPKYSSSFNKIDRDRNEFTKIDKAEREKVWLNCLLLSFCAVIDDLSCVWYEFMTDKSCSINFNQLLLFCLFVIGLLILCDLNVYCLFQPTRSLNVSLHWLLIFNVE